MFDFLALFPGVPLFFMVSGFLITDSYLNSQNLKEYFVKRGLRIYPALALNILILEFAMYIGGNMAGTSVSLFEYVIYLFAYISTAVAGIGTTLAGFSGKELFNYTEFFKYYPSGVLWTLSVELSFYVLLPMILFFKNTKIRNTLLLILIALAIFISSQASKEFYESSNLLTLLSISVFPYVWIFAIGVFMRLYWVEIKNYFTGYGIYWFGLYLAYCVAVTYCFGGLGNYKIGLSIETIIQTILLAFAMFSMAFSFTHIKLNRKTDLSYSTYLYHMLFVQILIGFGVTQSAYLYIVVFVSTLAVAYLSWTFVEKPMLKLKRANK